MINTGENSFVTTGPMLFLTVNGQEPGSIVSGDDARTLKISAQALSAYPLERLELVVNGKVVEIQRAGAGKKTILLETTYCPEGNSWIAARCKGEGHAHTSAVYIELNDEPNRAVEDKFIEYTADPQQVADILARLGIAAGA